MSHGYYNGEASKREHRPLGIRRYAVRGNGLLRARLRAETERHSVRLPPGAATGRRSYRSRGSGRGRIVHGNLDGGMDRSPYRARNYQAKCYRVDPVPGTDQYIATSLMISTFSKRARSRTLTSSIIGNVFGFKALKFAAPGRHADSADLRQDVSRASTRHRHGARVPEQVRPATAWCDDETQARTIRAQLRARRL